MSRFKLLPWLCLAVFISGIESLSAGEELFMGEPIPEMKPVRFAEELEKCCQDYTELNKL